MALKNSNSPHRCSGGGLVDRKVVIEQQVTENSDPALLYLMGYFSDLALPCCPGGDLTQATTNSGSGECTYGWRWDGNSTPIKVTAKSNTCLIADRFYSLYSGKLNHATGVNAGYVDSSVRFLVNSDTTSWYLTEDNPKSNGVGPLFRKDSAPAVLYFDES